ncbi:hypothetical protein ACP70R_036003 [Stipagrostis hirtigluma subsp. patula]
MERRGRLGGRRGRGGHEDCAGGVGEAVVAAVRAEAGGFAAASPHRCLGGRRGGRRLQEIWPRQRSASLSGARQPHPPHRGI